ncbi:MAG: hypothetical protein A2Y38_18050 [Spirochaetes bacterium GWB1_59_5]|nr:MAG: hypothetical protein A2Y38_18050 [Spirochaetes bacterium GWB1_59_5]
MQSIPALVQVAVIFALVVVASARKLHLGLAAAAGGLILALWRGLPLLDVARVALAEVLNPDTIFLVLLMACIMAFSAAMKKSGAMSAFSSALAAVAPSPRFAMAIAPMLIGTLPVPGGAILSAPLVDAMDPDRTRGAAVLSAANYWFRHSLELAWPLYPAFILTCSLSGLSAGRLMALNSYAMPALFFAGLLFILPARRSQMSGAPRGKEALGARLAAFAAGFAPLALVLGTYILLDGLWSAIAPSFSLTPRAAALIGRFAPIYLGIAVGSLKVRLSPTGTGAFKGSVGLATFKLIAVIVGIRVFSVLLGAAGVADAVAGELAAAGIPTIVAVAVLPLVAGLITGVGFGYVGLAFPIVLGLVPAGGAFPREAAVVLAGAFGYAGMMLSPLHVCMVVSSEHFGVGLAATIRRFAAPLAVFIAVAVGYVSLLALVLG